MNKKVMIGVDIGGSHISAALVDTEDGSLLKDTFCKEKVAVHEDAGPIICQWLSTLHKTLSRLPDCQLQGIGIALPGPFEYTEGVSLIEGVNKYDRIYGLNIRAALQSSFSKSNPLPIVFENDAACFGLGETLSGVAAGCHRVIAITLGTGFGATFIAGSRIVKEGTDIPPGGVLYNMPFKDGIAEDHISSKWITDAYEQSAGQGRVEPFEIAQRALQQDDHHARIVFETLGESIAACLLPWVKAFRADAIVLGGSISQAWPLFLPVIRKALDAAQLTVRVTPSVNREWSAISGAAQLVQIKIAQENTPTAAPNAPPVAVVPTEWRKSSQALMPAQTPVRTFRPGEYNMYPWRSLGDSKIVHGYDSLAEWISHHKTVIIDGYVGNDWTAIREQISACLYSRNIKALWFESFAFEKSEKEINSLVAPFLGEPGSVWGKKTTLSLSDLFRMDKLSAPEPGNEHALTLIIGSGAALCGWNAPVIYIDLPKNELQYRMRAGAITNLGAAAPGTPTEMYKRFYFVDWVLMNNHRQAIKDRIALVADGQWKDDLTWAPLTAIREGLTAAAHNIFRVRPWFEAGAWGGQWLKQQIPDLPQQEVNYAWSFELIVPENGLVFESNGHLLEISFDWLMEQEAPAVLGKEGTDRFGTEFPIRFDFLDTFDGGNLSIQCHPSLPYIREKFGEHITQDETYYILDCKENAGVYLGFQDDINPTAFRAELETSIQRNIPVDIRKHIQQHPAKKHDLFLIPNGTVHSAGINNLVLEISATPYIFTFKMYDWLRLDLNGEPRPINIEHAFNNLDFQRKGARVQQELISKPTVIEKKEDYQLIHLPTHPEHFYDVHRIEFLTRVNIPTEGKCHVLMLVEGQSILIVTAKGETHRFSYAETFVIPAAAGSYTVINEGSGQIRLIKAFLK